jgi:uncharacterized protein YbaP (TraB family)
MRARATSAFVLMISLLLSTGSAAQAQQAACAGKDLLAELAQTDPSGHARILTASAATPNAKGLLWRIEKAGLAPSYLFGTAHISDKRVTELSPAVAAAFKTAKRVALELADLSPETVAPVMQRLGHLFQDPSGQSLKTLSQGDYQAVREALAKRGIPAEVAHRLRPWFLFISLALPACEQAAQAQGKKWLDQQLADDAKANGVPVTGLETVESQMQALASLSPATQLALLIVVARLDHRAEDALEALINGYTRRDLGFVWPLQVYFHEKLGLPRSAVDEIEAAMLTRRNHVMRDAALPLLAEGSQFIAVGSLHLAGREGLVELLRQAGYTVTVVE